MHSENNENENDNDVIDSEAVETESVDTDEAVETETVDPEQTVVMSEDTFADPDISMEVNVEKLVAELEGTDDDEAHRKAEIRRRLEELADDGSFEDTYAIDIKDD